MLAHAERCREEIERLEGAEERSAEAEAALAAAEARRAELGEAAERAAARPRPGRCRSGSRRSSSGWRWRGRRSRSCSSRTPTASAPTGRETVELRVATNPGIEPAPLRDAASGGELSRVMLALSGLGAGGGAPGRWSSTRSTPGSAATPPAPSASGCGRSASERQVICITHLPQVASLADAHFRLEKDVAGEQAVATVERLEGDGVVAEIGRMLGGDGSDEAAEQPRPRAARRGLSAALAQSALGLT